MEKFQQGRKITFAPGVVFEITENRDGLVKGFFQGETETFSFLESDIDQHMKGFMLPPEITQALDLIRRSRSQSLQEQEAGQEASSDSASEKDSLENPVSRVPQTSGKTTITLYILGALILLTSLTVHFMARGKSAGNSEPQTLVSSMDSRANQFARQLRQALSLSSQQGQLNLDPISLTVGEWSFIMARDGLMVARGKKLLDPWLLIAPFIEKGSSLPRRSDEEATSTLILPMEEEYLKALGRWFALDRP